MPDDPETARIRAEDARWAESLREAHRLNAEGRVRSCKDCICECPCLCGCPTCGCRPEDQSGRVSS